MKFLAGCSLAIIALAVQGCGALSELEDENARLTARVDSLEVENAECGARMSAAADRMSALEQENLNLSEKNRKMWADLAVQPAQSAQGEGAAVLPPPQERGGEAPPAPREAESAAPAAQPAARKSAPAARTTPPAPAQKTTRASETGAAQKPTRASETGAGEKTSLASEHAPAAPVRGGLAGFAADVQADNAFLSRYQSALDEFNRKNYAGAISQFDALLTGGARNDMIDNCAYWIGESFFAQGRYREAMLRFSDVIALTASDKADDALMMRGNTALKLGDTAAARRDYTTLVSMYPSSEYVARAQAKLKTLP